MAGQLYTIPRASHFNHGDEEQIHELLGLLSAAIVERDINKILGCYSDDAIIYDVMDDLMVAKDKLRESWQMCFENCREFKSQLVNPKLQLADNIALCFGFAHITGKSNKGTAFNMWARTTMGFTKVYGQWQICHEHVSFPTDFTTGKTLTQITPDSFLS